MRRVFLFGAALIVLGASGARTSTPQIDSTQKAVELPDTIIVTANRFGLASTKCIWPTALVARSTLNASATLSDALSSGAGVDLRDYTGAGSVATLSNWGTFNRHMLLLYDGRVVRDYSLGGFNLSEYSPAEFDRVELLKGPQSAFYGSDAIGGVVNLVPKNMLADRAEITSQVGSFGFERHRVAASHKIGGLGIGGWGELMNSDNNRTNAGAKAESYGFRTDYLSASGKLKLHATARAFHDSLGSPGPVPAFGDTVSLGNFESTSLFDHQKDKNVSLDAQLRWTPTASTDIRIDGFFDRKKLTFVTRFEENWNDPVDTAQTDTDYRKRSSGVTARIQHEHKSASLAGGIDWLYGSLDYRNQQQSPFAPLPDHWTGSQHQFDLWSSLASDVNSGLRPDLSGRLSFVRGREVQPSYNAGLVATLSPQVRLRVGYGFAYRLPSIADQFAQDAYTKGNPELNAERSRTLAATVSAATPDNKWSARITGFGQQVSELIQYQYDPSLFQYVPKNVNKFRSAGMDINVRSTILSRATVELSAVYQHARQTLDSTLQYVDAYYVPDLIWSLSVDYSPVSRLSVGSEMKYTSDRWILMYGGDEKTIKQVYELGAHIRYAIARTVQLSVSAEDLTDRHRPGTFGYTITDRDYPSPGRRIFVRLTAYAGK